MRPYSRLWALWQDEDGATAPEYALIAAFIALAIFAAVQALGVSLKAPLNDVHAGIDARTK
jgi:Flp pilus assembly pilin Flp